MATATTFNRSNILKSAWNLVKTAGKSFSEALRQAWAEAKAPKVDKPVELAKKVLVWDMKKFRAIAEFEYDGLFDPNFDLEKSAILTMNKFVEKAKKEGSFISFENQVLTFYK